MNRFAWPLLIYALYLPYIYGQGALYKLNPELANEFVMPVLLAVQPALVPFAGVAGIVFVFLNPRPDGRGWTGASRVREGTGPKWTRNVLLIALWAIAIEFLFSLRLNPFTAIAKVNP